MLLIHVDETECPAWEVWKKQEFGTGIAMPVANVVARGGDSDRFEGVPMPTAYAILAVTFFHLWVPARNRA